MLLRGVEIERQNPTSIGCAILHPIQSRPLKAIVALGLTFAELLVEAGVYQRIKGAVGIGQVKSEEMELVKPLTELK